MANAVIGHEHHHRVVGDAFLLQAVNDFPNLDVDEIEGIQVPCPVLSQHGVNGIVGRQFHVGRVDRRWDLRRVELLTGGGAGTAAGS